MNHQNINLKDLFLLDKDITYLNHGSFGATPKPIFNELQKFQLLLEKQPVSFLDAHINENILAAQKSLSEFINCNYDDIVFFTNPTTAINEIMRSIPLNEGDEVLSSTHEYGALDKAWNFICQKRKANYIKATINVPIKSTKVFYETFLSAITPKTKAIFISHITSSTGLILPIDEIIKYAKKNGILTIIDGAHAPGHIPLDIEKLDPDIYTGTCHKWLLCPKGTSFLYVKKNIQNLIEPLIVSWGYDNSDYLRTPFQNNHLWQGTQDISKFLTIPKAIKFREDYNWVAVSERNKKMILDFRNEIHNKFEIPPLFESNPETWLGQMFSFPITNKINESEKIKSVLINKYKIEIPVFEWSRQLYLRISINGYNSERDMHKLMDILPIFIK